MKYAIIDKDTNIVQNVVEWEGRPWTPPNNSMLVQSDTAGIGDIYDISTNTFRRV